MPRNPNQRNRPNSSTPQRPSQPSRPRPSRPHPAPESSRPPQQPQRPQPPRPSPSRPQPQHPRPHPTRPHQHNPRWPNGMIPHMPHRPRPPSVSFMPQGFPIWLQCKIGLIVSPHREVTMRRRPTRFSQAVGTIPHHTFVWIFGENNGWFLVHFNGQYGFVNSRFIIT